MMRTFDIIVIGAGPAGAVFAKSISKEFSVACIDKKSDDEGSFKKPCGGLLAPDGQKALSELGLNLPKSVLVDPQIFSVRTIDLDSGLTRHYQRMYINCDRHRFDRWLMSGIEENVTLFCGTVTKIEKQEKRYIITFVENKKEQKLSARYIVGADGAKSGVRKFLNPDYRCRQYLSIQQWFEDKHPKPFYSCIFDSENTDCYSWAVSKDGLFIFGGAYPVKGGKEAFSSQKKKLCKKGFVFGEPIKTEACLVLRPQKLSDFYTGKENAFLIGEAAGLISPSSLEGISSAIISGKALAEAFNTKKNIRREYENSIRPLKRKLLFKNFKCPFLYQPFLRNLVMKSGISSIKVSEKNQ
ncbi:MAG: FAD-binding protein [Oscillospiraceae bacterium]